MKQKCNETNLTKLPWWKTINIYTKCHIWFWWKWNIFFWQLLNYYFWDSRGSCENWLEPKIKPQNQVKILWIQIMRNEIYFKNFILSDKDQHKLCILDNASPTIITNHNYLNWLLPCCFVIVQKMMIRWKMPRWFVKQCFSTGEPHWNFGGSPYFWNPHWSTKYKQTKNT